MGGGEDKEIVLSAEVIRQRVETLGQQISKDYAGRELVLVGILNGAFIFLADLARAICIPHQIDFIRVASYGQSSASSGSVQLRKDVELPLENKAVLLVEDIIDTGVTLSWLLEHFRRRADSVGICALIDKTERRQVPLTADYVGFQVPQGFLVGYGLDFAERHRHYPAVYSLTVSH
ncbi:MAG: hypoxanthine phosphoribosyltransferase [Desulfobulbaceae bacterium A2]|nr:MAG: hypoxanthine phosphoribosyltransferase [Desulfobulbaceae bacterium A2]